MKKFIIKFEGYCVVEAENEKSAIDLFNDNIQVPCSEASALADWEVIVKALNSYSNNE